MKTPITMLVLLCAVLLSGCASTNQKNAGSFLKKVADLNIVCADITQSTSCPLYSHSESAEGITRDREKGSLIITNIKAEFQVPLWGFKTNFSATAIEISKANLPAIVEPQKPSVTYLHNIQLYTQVK